DYDFADDSDDQDYDFADDSDDRDYDFADDSDDRDYDFADDSDDRDYDFADDSDDRDYDFADDYDDDFNDDFDDDFDDDFYDDFDDYEERESLEDNDPQKEIKRIRQRAMEELDKQLQEQVFFERTLVTPELDLATFKQTAQALGKEDEFTAQVAQFIAAEQQVTPLVDRDYKQYFEGAALRRLKKKPNLRLLVDISIDLLALHKQAGTDLDNLFKAYALYVPSENATALEQTTLYLEQAIAVYLSASRGSCIDLMCDVDELGNEEISKVLFPAIWHYVQVSLDITLNPRATLKPYYGVGLEPDHYENPRFFDFKQAKATLEHDLGVLKNLLVNIGLYYDVFTELSVYEHLEKMEEAYSELFLDHLKYMLVHYLPIEFLTPIQDWLEEVTTIRYFVDRLAPQVTAEEEPYYFRYDESFAEFKDAKVNEGKITALYLPEVFARAPEARLRWIYTLAQNLQVTPKDKQALSVAEYYEQREDLAQDYMQILADEPDDIELARALASELRSFWDFTDIMFQNLKQKVDYKRYLLERDINGNRIEKKQGVEFYTRVNCDIISKTYQDQDMIDRQDPLIFPGHIIKLLHSQMLQHSLNAALTTDVGTLKRPWGVMRNLLSLQDYLLHMQYSHTKQEAREITYQAQNLMLDLMRHLGGKKVKEQMKAKTPVHGKELLEQHLESQAKIGENKELLAHLAGTANGQEQIKAFKEQRLASDKPIETKYGDKLNAIMQQIKLKEQQNIEPELDPAQALMRDKGMTNDPLITLIHLVDLNQNSQTQYEGNKTVVERYITQYIPEGSERSAAAENLNQQTADYLQMQLEIITRTGNLPKRIEQEREELLKTHPNFAAQPQVVQAYLIAQRIIASCQVESKFKVAIPSVTNGGGVEYLEDLKLRLEKARYDIPVSYEDEFARYRALRSNIATNVEQVITALAGNSEASKQVTDAVHTLVTKALEEQLENQEAHEVVATTVAKERAAELDDEKSVAELAASLAVELNELQMDLAQDKSQALRAISLIDKDIPLYELHIDGEDAQMPLNDQALAQLEKLAEELASKVEAAAHEHASEVEHVSAGAPEDSAHKVQAAQAQVEAASTVDRARVSELASASESTLTLTGDEAQASTDQSQETVLAPFAHLSDLQQLQDLPVDPADWDKEKASKLFVTLARMAAHADYLDTLDEDDLDLSYIEDAEQREYFRAKLLAYREKRRAENPDEHFSFTRNTPFHQVRQAYQQRRAEFGEQEFDALVAQAEYEQEQRLHTLAQLDQIFVQQVIKYLDESDTKLKPPMSGFEEFKIKPYLDQIREYFLGASEDEEVRGTIAQAMDEADPLEKFIRKRSSLMRTRGKFALNKQELLEDIEQTLESEKEHIFALADNFVAHIQAAVAANPDLNRELLDAELINDTQALTELMVELLSYEAYNKSIASLNPKDVSTYLAKVQARVIYEQENAEVEDEEVLETMFAIDGPEYLSASLQVEQAVKAKVDDLVNNEQGSDLAQRIAKYEAAKALARAARIAKQDPSQAAELVAEQQEVIIPEPDAEPAPSIALESAKPNKESTSVYASQLLTIGDDDELEFFSELISGSQLANMFLNRQQSYAERLEFSSPDLAYEAAKIAQNLGHDLDDIVTAQQHSLGADINIELMGILEDQPTIPGSKVLDRIELTDRTLTGYQVRRVTKPCLNPDLSLLFEIRLSGLDANAAAVINTQLADYDPRNQHLYGTVCYSEYEQALHMMHQTFKGNEDIPGYNNRGLLAKLVNMYSLHHSLARDINPEKIPPKRLNSAYHTLRRLAGVNNWLQGTSAEHEEFVDKVNAHTQEIVAQLTPTQGNNPASKANAPQGKNKANKQTKAANAAQANEQASAQANSQDNDSLNNLANEQTNSQSNSQVSPQQVDLSKIEIDAQVNFEDIVNLVSLASYDNKKHSEDFISWLLSVSLNLDYSLVKEVLSHGDFDHYYERFLISYNYAVKRFTDLKAQEQEISARFNKNKFKLPQVKQSVEELYKYSSLRSLEANGEMPMDVRMDTLSPQVFVELPAPFRTNAFALYALRNNEAFIDKKGELLSKLPRAFLKFFKMLPKDHLPLYLDFAQYMMQGYWQSKSYSLLSNWSIYRHHLGYDKFSIYTSQVTMPDRPYAHIYRSPYYWNGIDFANQIVPLEGMAYLGGSFYKVVENLYSQKAIESYSLVYRRYYPNNYN
ncbi:hypothetical protein, partial [Psittacicella hinzii]